MSDFFKQLLTQLRDVWTRFNTLQKVILISVFAVTFIGLILSIAVSSLTGKDESQVTLFANLDLDQAAQITAYLKENKFLYELDNDGRTIMVPKEQIYDIRMELARAGLPEKGGKGFELFDKTQLGMTDFVQNLNYRRALENELSRSIESIKEIEKARVHINIPKATLFTEKKEESTASVMVKLRPNAELTTSQVSGITYLVSSAVEGLRARQVTVLDQHGKMLTKGFAEDEIGESTNHNIELTRSTEKYMEQKVENILSGVLGPDKAKVKVTLELDFDRITKTSEVYDPSKKVVRSEQRDDGARKNSPSTGDETKEGSITNYEIDKTIAQIVQVPGSRKRMTVSVAVDGTYETDKEGKRTYVPRKPEELEVLNQLVRNAVGYDSVRSDQVYVASVQFDKSYLEEEMQALKSMENKESVEFWVMRGLIAVIILLGFIALKSIAKNISEAMNPPIPRYAGIDLEIEEEEVPEHVKRQNEILDRMEEFARDNPVNMAELIRTWLLDTEEEEPRAPKKKNK